MKIRNLIALLLVVAMLLVSGCGETLITGYDTPLILNMIARFNVVDMQE